MRYLLLLLTTLIIVACEQQTPKINFYAAEDYDTLFPVQDGEGHFVTGGLVNLLENGLVTSALFTTISYDTIKDEVLLTKENYFHHDSTMNYGFTFGIAYIDPIAEQFNPEPAILSKIGQLEVHYASGDTITYVDTLKFVRINPLVHQRLSGELQNNKRVGSWTTYYDNERTLVLRKSNFKEGLRHGSDSVFYPDGKLSVVANWINGKRNGTVETFSEYSGNVTSRVTFSNGEPTSKLYFFDHYNNPIDSIDTNSL